MRDCVWCIMSLIMTTLQASALFNDLYIRDLALS